MLSSQSLIVDQDILVVTAVAFDIPNYECRGFEGSKCMLVKRLERAGHFQIHQFLFLVKLKFNFKK